MALTAALIVGASASGIVLAQPAPDALAQTTHTFNLPAQPLGDALNELARQTGLQLLVRRELVEGKQAPSVIGKLSTRQALDRLLAGNGLSATVEGTTVVLRRTLVAPGAETVLPTVNVTATGTKRDLTLQEATQSIAVFRERDVTGMQTGFDVTSQVPNVVMQSKYLLPVVRGVDGNGVSIGMGGAVSGASPRMANYVDGVARTFGGSPDGLGSFWDIEQVEIYRGSQSTQIGQNAIAGAIIQKTKDPVFKDEFAVQAGVRSGDTTYNAALMANKKLGDQTAARFTSEAIDGDGFVNYAGFNDINLSAADRSSLSEIKYTRNRLKILSSPTNDLIIGLLLENEKSNGPFTVDQVDKGNRRRLSSSGNYSHHETNNTIAAVNAVYAVNAEWTLDAIISNQSAKTNFGAPRVGSPDPSAYLDFTFKSNETAFEPKLTYKAQEGRTSAIIGVLHKTRDRKDVGQSNSSFPLSADDKLTVTSVYADSTLQVSEYFDLIAGGRAEKSDHKRIYQDNFGASFTADISQSKFLPKIGFAYHPREGSSIGLVAYTGHNAGGGGWDYFANGFTGEFYTFRPESSRTLEGFVRTEWLNKRLAINGSVFQTKYKDMQSFSTAASGGTIISNVERSTISGAELDMNYQVGSSGKVFGGIGLLSSKIDEFSLAPTQAGRELALTPKLSARFGASIEVLSNLIVNASVTYLGPRFKENDESERLGGYTLSNVFATYRHGDFTYTAFVNNLFDKFAVISGYSTNEKVTPPRTIGANLKYEF
jgi:outer membrane receptor protein involved in Fe transport